MFLEFIPADRAEISHMITTQNSSREPSQPGYRAHMKRPLAFVERQIFKAFNFAYHTNAVLQLRIPRARLTKNSTGACRDRITRCPFGFPIALAVFLFFKNRKYLRNEGKMKFETQNGGSCLLTTVVNVLFSGFADEK